MSRRPETFPPSLSPPFFPLSIDFSARPLSSVEMFSPDYSEGRSWAVARPSHWPWSCEPPPFVVIIILIEDRRIKWGRAAAGGRRRAYLVFNSRRSNINCICNTALHGSISRRECNPRGWPPFCFLALNLFRKRRGSPSTYISQETGTMAVCVTLHEGGRQR